MPETAKDIGRLEGRMDALEDWMQAIDTKVDKLLALAQMGKGAGWVILKVGVILGPIVMTSAWLWGHVLRGAVK